MRFLCVVGIALGVSGPASAAASAHQLRNSGLAA